MQFWDKENHDKHEMLAPKRHTELNKIMCMNLPCQTTTHHLKMAPGETDTSHLLKKLLKYNFFPKIKKNPILYLAVDFVAILPEYND